MNAINDQLHREVRAAALEAGKNTAGRAVVLYGGERVFAAGADIKAMADLDGTGMTAGGRELTTSFTEVARLPKPVIAAITGYALGGGYELALAADFRVMGTSAKIGQPEILLGVIPGAGGTQRLARLVGPARAQGIVFTRPHVRAAGGPGNRLGGAGGVGGVGGPAGAKDLFLPGRAGGRGGGGGVGLGGPRPPGGGVLPPRRDHAPQFRRRPAAGAGGREARDRRGARRAAGPGP